MEKGVGLDPREEFTSLDFNSKRLQRRFIKTMETLACQPDKSIWLCSENRAEAKAIYRLLRNEKLDREEILRTHREATLRRMVQCERTVLAIQDTTSLNYDTHRKMEGLGYISDKTQGVNIHTCLAVTTDGLVLGLLSQSSYNREQAKDDSRTPRGKQTRALEEKESYRWVSCLEESTGEQPEGVHLVTVCDREGDMYELFDAAEQTGQSFLIRITHNRKTVENEKTVDAIRKTPCTGRIAVTIPRDSRKGLAERDAILQIRYERYGIQRPQIRDADKHLRPCHELTMIHVLEETGKGKGEPLEWFLITNEEVRNVEGAYEKVRWYTLRWKIEQFHYVLKSGCNVEKLQERSMEKTTTLVLMYSIIAAAIMNLTYAGRFHPELPCTLFFEETEWKLLYSTANETKKVPDKPYTIVDAVKYLGWLGGPKGAPSDGPPGVKTIWTGLEKLNILLAFREWMV